MNSAAQEDVLPPGVRHVRCDNPGPMTLTGTNSYVLDVEGRPAVVIDPGPEHPTHREALMRALDGASEVDVLLTHHHDDHEGGAAALVAALRQQGVRAHLWGGISGDHLVDGVVLHDLQVVLAPGHTADSAVFLLRRGAWSALFSGDTLLGGSSSFIAHPDGDLTDYLATLDVLETLLAETPDAVLAPGHGDLGARALDVVRAYRSHREQRLDEVRRALASTATQTSSQARTDAVIERVYGGVDAALRPAVEAVVAAQIAHLDRLI